MKPSVAVGLLLFSVLAAVAAVLAVVFIPFLDRSGLAAELAVTEPIPARAAAPQVEYFPPRPAQAPDAWRADVMRGQDLISDTRHKLPAHSGNSLSCAHCHFSAGLSDGGKNSGFSLVGVAARLPANAVAELNTRVAACFRRNLNAQPPASDSPEMLAMLAYLRWISAGVPYLGDVPWLHMRPLTRAGDPDLAAGQRTLREICSPCHGAEGQGTPIAPALYGPQSFTAQSQMLDAGIIEQFIHDNMPRGNPNLSEGTAVDVAAHVRAQERPHAP
jgi:thiosulfate dehydrogenase